MTDARLDGNSLATCLDDETIGSFVDGTIDSVGRKRVVEHVAACADCCELVAEVTRTNSDLEENGAAPIPGQPPRISRRVYLVTAVILAIAASVLFVILYRTGS